jgi:hypothetical protein
LTLAPALIDIIASRSVTKLSTATVSPVLVTVIVAACAGAIAAIESAAPSAIARGMCAALNRLSRRVSSLVAESRGSAVDSIAQALKR